MDNGVPSGTPFVMPMFTVYQVVHIPTGKSYIGFTSQNPPIKRWEEHQAKARLGSKHHFHRALRKDGLGNFVWTILEQGWDARLGLNIREPYWISVLKPEYNETAGGEGTIGLKHPPRSKEYKQAQSVAHKGKKNLRTSLSSIGNSNRLGRGLGFTPWNKGKTNTCQHSEQGLAKLKAINTGMNHPQYGTKHSTETRLKMRASRLRFLESKKVKV